MKKYLILCGITSLTMVLTSCFKEDNQTATQTIIPSAINIITSAGSDDVVVSAGYYSFDLDLIERTGTIASSDLIFDNTSYKFTSESAPFKSPYGTEVWFENVSADVNGNSKLDLTNAVFMGLTALDIATEEENSYGYYYTTANAAEYTYTPNPYFPWRAFAWYGIGSDMVVHTYLPDTFYRGETTTQYPSAEGMAIYTTDAITYRFILDLEEKTATMVIYNAKFSASEREPIKAAIIAKGLDYKFSANGLSITGENIIPDIVEANMSTPNETFVFNTIDFATTDAWWVRGELNYTVAGIYQGNFKGSYIKSSFVK